MANEAHVYIAPEASGLSFRQVVNEDTEVFVQFVDGNYRTDDEDLAKAIDLAIAQGHLSRWVRKVDRSAAERLVHQHIAERKATGAQSGQATTAQTAMLSQLQARDQEMHKLTNEDQVVAAMKDDNDLLMTEQVAAPVVAVDETAKVATPVAESKPAGLVFGNKAAEQ